MFGKCPHCGTHASPTPEDIAELESLLKSGHTYRDVMHLLGIGSKKTVEKYARRMKERERDKQTMPDV